MRGLVRAALLDDSGQTNACCALLVTPTRGPERLEGCAQPPHQQERTRPEVAGSARHQAAATRSESVKSTPPLVVAAAAAQIGTATKATKKWRDCDVLAGNSMRRDGVATKRQPRLR